MTQNLYRRNPNKVENTMPCPLCDQLVNVAPYKYKRDDEDELIYFCDYCDFLFGRPAFISDHSQRQMDSVEDAELYGSNLLRFLHRELILKREVRNVRSILGSGQHRILDIGCGTGWTSAFWRDQGFEVVGLEPSEARRSIARERYDIPVVGEYLEDADFEMKFDLVILRHIIEHFECPVELLQKASRFVEPNGLLLIIVPNIKCLGRFLFDTDWTWVLPWHCNFFSPRSLNLLIQKVGFQEVKSYQTPSPIYYQESFLRKYSSPWLRRVTHAVSPAGMFLFFPLILGGVLAGKGDNLCSLAVRQGFPKNIN